MKINVIRKDNSEDITMNWYSLDSGTIVILKHRGTLSMQLIPYDSGVEATSLQAVNPQDKNCTVDLRFILKTQNVL